MSWNKDAAVSYLRSHALGCSHSECAKDALMKRIFLSFVMLLVGCCSAANQERSAQDATESFYKSYLPYSAAMKPGLILPTNCVNMFLLILLLVSMLFRKSLNKS